ncbi:unnamed protein product [Boreogadus saida]
MVAGEGVRVVIVLSDAYVNARKAFVYGTGAEERGVTSEVRSKLKPPGPGCSSALQGLGAPRRCRAWVLLGAAGPGCSSALQGLLNPGARQYL